MDGAVRRMSAMVGKDLQAFARDRFFMVVTFLGLAFYIGVLALLPATVEETVSIGVTGLDLPAAASAALGEGADQGLAVSTFEDSESLRAAVEGDAEETVAAGIVFPADFVADTVAGESVTVEVLVTADVPPEIRTAVTGMVREMAFLAAGEPLPVTRLDANEVVVGTDRVGDQVSIREQMRPLFAFAVLLTESLALATLVAGEIHTRTATALLVTPLRVGELLGAKAVVGTLLAFAELLVLLALTGTLQIAPGPLLLTSLLGAVLVTGVGLIAGSLGQDFLGIIGWSILFLVPMMIPAFTVLFPGSTAAWVTWLPSHGFVAALDGLANQGLSLDAVAGDLASLIAWSIAALGVGWVVLGRRVANL